MRSLKGTTAYIYYLTITIVEIIIALNLLLDNSEDKIGLTLIGVALLNVMPLMNFIETENK